MKEIAEKFQKFGVVPVVVLEDTKDAVPLAKALVEGGLPCAEVTFRTEAAEESIRLMAEQFPEMLVGAGTVLTTEQVDAAVGAGAKFIVSPGLNPKTVRYCQEKNIPILPGVATASEIEQALGKYIRDPVVTVIVGGFVGPYSQQIRVIGEAARPQTLPYRQKMSMLDVMIAVGGITDFADGNRATLLRTSEGNKQYSVRLKDLVKRGDVSANVELKPGDVLIIPQSWF